MKLKINIIKDTELGNFVLCTMKQLAKYLPRRLKHSSFGQKLQPSFINLSAIITYEKYYYQKSPKTQNFVLVYKQ